MSPLPLILVANVAIGKPWATVACTTLAAYPALLTALLGANDLLGSALGATGPPGLSPESRYGLDAGYIVTAFAAGGFVFKPIRRDVSALLSIDPDNPVHALALSLAVVFLGTNVATIAFTDVLATDQAQPPLTILDLFLTETPFLILALAGVGLVIRRNIGQAAGRLGVVRPAWWHLALAFACAGAFDALAQGSDALDHLWAPGLANRVDAVSQHLFAGLDNPIGIAALALLPGVCEELLFRGALQPRFGLLATALLFTSIHTQYGLSVVTLGVFANALGLGLIRKYVNTTASCACHVGYNLLQGVGIGSGIVGAAVVVEVILLTATGWGIWSSRRTPAAAAKAP